MSNDAWNANQYEKFKNERSQPFFDLMELLKPVSAAEIIDLGCGTGELTQVLHQQMRAKMTVGLDSSSHMLEKAQKFSTENLQFQKGDISKWRQEQKFDIIFSNAAIQWCDCHQEILSNLKASLKAQGQLAIQMPLNQDYPTHLTAYRMAQESPWKQKLKSEDRVSSFMLKPEQYAEEIYRLGFREQKVFVRVYTHILNSREDVVEWVKGTLLTPFKARFSENDYDSFLKEFKGRLFDELPDDKPFFYPFKRLFIWGQLS